MTIIQANNLEKAYLDLVNKRKYYGNNIDLTIAEITKFCTQALNAQRASVWLYSNNNTLFHCKKLYLADQEKFLDDFTISRHDFPNYFDALDNSRVIDAADVLQDKRTKELAESYLIPENIKSLLDAPLRQHGVTQGVLCIETVGVMRDWQADEKMFVASIGDFLSQIFLIDQLIQREARFTGIYEGTSEGIFILEADKIIDVNNAACRIFKGEREELIGLTPIDLSPQFQDDNQLSLDKAMKYIQKSIAGEPQNFEWTHKRLDGRDFYAEITLNSLNLNGKSTLVGIIRDISEKKAVEKATNSAVRRIEFFASHDSLTELENRYQLHRYINRIINLATESNDDTKIALLLLDLNRFKEINDTLGHTTGDKVLKKLAILLKTPIKQNAGNLYRLGGDEFVAVFNSKSCPIDFVELPNIIHQSLNTSILIDDMPLETSASIGLSIYPDDGIDSHELLRCADVAMYQAKNHGKGTVWYDNDTDQNSRKRLSMIVELNNAIRENQLVLHYQPRIDLQTNIVAGCEALLRWQHPKHGLVPPSEFLHLAEVGEAIHHLSEWVFSAAAKQIRHMESLGFNIPIAINISARNLGDSRLVDFIEKYLQDEPIEPYLIEIEITESAFMQNPKRALESLNRLAAMGLSIAIDDFGTGYSSLSYLKQLSVDTLKIDRSFVKDMLTSESDRIIVNSTINLAHNFSLRVIAEGVEDEETLHALMNLQCDQVQGYYISKPLPSSELDTWLQSYNHNQYNLNHSNQAQINSHY